LAKSCLIMSSDDCFSSPFFLRQRPESRGFVLLKACQYQSMGET
jgi:hypothetical protein